MEKEKNKKETEQEPDAKSAKTPALELFVALIGFVLVGATIGFLIFDALTEKDTPPQIVIETKEIVPLPNGYLVKFEVENQGDNHASEVEIEGKLMDGEKEKQTSSVTVGYAPSHSKRMGGMFFTENPKEFDLKFRTMGYAEP